MRRRLFVFVNGYGSGADEAVDRLSARILYGAMRRCDSQTSQMSARLASSH
jgi:hypothetical protein